MTYSSKRILIIDTRDEWLFLAESVLSAAGHEVVIARSIQEAKEILTSNGNRFDLVLADQKAAEADRQTLHDMIWVEPDRRRRVVVVFPTALQLPKMREVFKLGAFDCVDKEYEPDKLIGLVERIFEHPFFAKAE